MQHVYIHSAVKPEHPVGGPWIEDFDWLTAHHALHLTENIETSEGGLADSYLHKEVTVSQTSYLSK